MVWHEQMAPVQGLGDLQLSYSSCHPSKLPKEGYARDSIRDYYRATLRGILRIFRL